MGRTQAIKKRIAITSITIPDGTKAKVNTTTVVPVTINPIGGNDTIIIAELNISYMDSVQYSPEKRELTLVANSVGTSQIRFSWNSGQEYKDFFIPVEN
nr:MAG: hypothetical protein [Bacteriophage sp.]